MTSARTRSARRRAAVAILLSAVLGALPLAAPAGAAPAPDDPGGPPPPTTSAGFTEHLDFEQYTPGALDGQDGWTASPATAVVPDPLNGNNFVLTQSGPSIRAFREVPAIADGETGTLFFRMLRSGKVDTSFGLTDVDAPSTTSHSRAYVNHQNDDVLRVRDGGAFATAGSWSRRLLRSRSRRVPAWAYTAGGRRRTARARVESGRCCCT